MQLFSVFQEAIKRVGNETTKMSESDIKKAIGGKLPKWIRELTPAQQKKYAILIRRFTIDKESSKKPELLVNGFRIPTVIPRAIIEPLMKKNLEIDKIVEKLQGYSYGKQKDKLVKTGDIKTSKMLKTGQRKEKPLIGKLSKILERDLTDREKEVAIYLSEKPKGAWKWAIEDLEGLLNNPNFQKDLKEFEPWNAKAFSEMVIKTEARSTAELFHPRTKDESGKPLSLADIEAQKRAIKKNTMNMAMAIRQADDMDLIDFLKKNKSLFKPKRNTESTDSYLNDLFTSIRTFAIKNKNESIEYLMDDKLQSIKKKLYSQINDEIKTLEDLKDVLNKGTESIILSADMKRIRAEEEKAQKTKLFGKALKEAVDDERTKINALGKDLLKLAKEDAIEIPSWNGQMDINKYIKGLFTKFNVTPQISREFSREGRMQISAISTGIDEFKKPTSPINNLKDLANYLRLHYLEKFDEYKERLKDKNDSFEDANLDLKKSIKKYLSKYGKGVIPSDLT